MSEYTREEILNMIEENGGPQNLDLSGKDLSGIDLSKKAIAQELERIGAPKFRRNPVWQAPSPWGINLEKLKLSKAKLERARLSGAYLFDANLEGANLDYTYLEEAFLFGARLNKASLFETHLERASIGRAYFDQAYLCWTHLNGVDLSEASLLGTYFEGAYLNQTRIKKEQLGTRLPEEEQRQYRKAGEVYLLLKNNFNQIGRYDDASWAYVKERQMEKMTYHPKLARKYYAKTEGLPDEASPKSWTWWRFYVKYALKWLWDWITEGLCGYGEKPGRVLRAMLLLLVIAAFAYRLFGGLTHADGRVAGPLDYLVYSFDAFTRIVGTDLVPLTMWGHLVTGLEAFLAILLTSLVVYTLGRRMSRS